MSLTSLMTHSAFTFLFSPSFLLFTAWCRSWQWYYMALPGPSTPSNMAWQQASQSASAEAPSLVSHSRGVHGAFLDNSSCEICRELWLHHFFGPRPSVQTSNFHCFAIVYCNELPEPVHFSAATSHQQTCTHFLNWTSFSALIKLSQVSCGAA